MDHQEYYQHIDRLSLFYHYYAFLDTEEYLADQLFIKSSSAGTLSRRICTERLSIPSDCLSCAEVGSDAVPGGLEELPKKMLLAGPYKLSGYLLCTLGQSAPRRKEGGVRL